jgi:C4-dicarboxylate-specific signal transduction histidine kinase
MQKESRKRIMDYTNSNRKPVKKCDVERLAAIGIQSSMIAHELNNQLDGIMRYVDLAMRIVEQENLDKPKEYLTNCRKTLRRMARILGEMLEFSRATDAPSEYVEIGRLIDDVIKTVEHRAASLNVRISRNYAPDLSAVQSGNLIQVFINLARNALDTMPNGGELIISIRRAKNDTIAVEFRDTGQGLPPGDVEAIFEPFFTTKDMDKGTGLGLAICRDIIESYGGRITAENATEGGRLFTVYLPVTSQVEN